MLKWDSIMINFIKLLGFDNFQRTTKTNMPNSYLFLKAIFLLLNANAVIQNQS